MTRRNIFSLLLAEALTLFWSFGLLYGAANMVQSHSYVCNTISSIFILLIGYCLCKRPNKLELIGLAITCAGVACLFNDGSAERTDGKVAQWYHYAVSLSATFCGAISYMISGQLVK